MSDLAETSTPSYSELLTPAFPDGFEGFAELGLSADSDFMDKAQAFAIQVFAEIDKVDWEGSGLPDRNVVIRRQTETLGPRAYAKFITRKGFEDSISLIGMCEDIVRPKKSPATWLMSRLERRSRQQEPEDQVDIRALLGNSKQSILNKILGLSDGDKDLLLDSIRHPLMAQAQLGFPVTSRNHLLRLESDDGDATRFEWSYAVKSWMKDRTSTESGCPARNAIVETLDGKQPVTHFLWDKLVELRYPEQEASGIAAPLGILATAH